MLKKLFSIIEYPRLVYSILDEINITYFVLIKIFNYKKSCVKKKCGAKLFKHQMLYCIDKDQNKT